MSSALVQPNIIKSVLVLEILFATTFWLRYNSESDAYLVHLKHSLILLGSKMAVMGTLPAEICYLTHSKLLHTLCMLLNGHPATQYWRIVTGFSRGWHQTPLHLISYVGKSLICGTAVLGGATPLCHHIIQLISLEQHREEMYLSLRLRLGFLYSTLQASEQQYLICWWSCYAPAENLLQAR